MFTGLGKTGLLLRLSAQMMGFLSHSTQIRTTYTPAEPRCRLEMKRAVWRRSRMQFRTHRLQWIIVAAVVALLLVSTGTLLIGKFVLTKSPNKSSGSVLVPWGF